MKVLVTGAKGNLGREIIKCLNTYGLDVLSYSHSMSLSNIEWSSITTIINCAAVIPSKNVTNKKYLEGNVVFLQSLLKYSQGKVFIHFSTLSELYKRDFYQLTKMMANSLILANASIFERFSIIPLPTLEDEVLINKIVDLATAGEMPKVDRLHYNYMSFEDLAKFIKEKITNNFDIHITDFYIKKDLYTEVLKNIDSSLIIEGDFIDRTLFSDGVYRVIPELISDLSN